MDVVLLKSLKLSNFRNLALISWLPASRFNIVSGLNGMGKTNLIEAIYLFGALRSFRTTYKRELIHHDVESAHLQGVFGGAAAGLFCEIELKKNLKRFRVGEKNLSSPGEHFRQVPMVLFHPATMSLVQGGPSARRRFMDRALFQAETLYPRLHREYARALDHRNRLLKRSPVDQLSIESFDAQLAALGVQITRMRDEFLRILNTFFTNAFETISIGLKGELTYRPKAPENEDSYLYELRASIPKDTERGYTSLGPHADDIAIYINSKPARTFASQGQQRLVALALKIAETNVLAEKTGRVPILLLDDISSELDRQRNKMLFEFLSQFGGQVFITTTHTDHIAINKDRRDFVISNGKLEAVSDLNGQ